MRFLRGQSTTMKESDRYVILPLIFLMVFISHFASKNITSYDSRWSIHTAMSIIKTGDTNLDEYQEMIVKEKYYAVENIDGHSYSMFPIGASIIAVSLYILEVRIIKMFILGTQRLLTSIWTPQEYGIGTTFNSCEILNKFRKTTISYKSFSPCSHKYLTPSTASCARPYSLLRGTFVAWS